VGKQLKILEDHSHGTANVTYRAHDFGNVTIVSDQLMWPDADPPGAERAKAVYTTQERRLAAATRPDERYGLSGADRKINPFQDTPLAEAYDKPFDLEIG